MIGGKASDWIFCVGMGIFAVLGVILWFSHYYDFGDLCGPPPENGAQCFREWFGSAAGYLAVLVATFTVYPLYRQIAEQKKQTEFAVGDANPTLDVMIDRNDKEAIHVRVVNWNRRSILIEGIKTLNSTFHPVATKVRVDGQRLSPQEWAFETGVGVAKPILLKGWEDRNHAPHTAQIEIWGQDHAGKLVKFDGFESEFEVSIVVVGDKYRRIILHGVAGSGHL